MFVIILVMLFMICAMAFVYKRSKVQRNIGVNLTTTSCTPNESPPAYKPEDDGQFSVHPPIFTIANADSLSDRNQNVGKKDFIELPPTYEEAIVINQKENNLRRE